MSELSKDQKEILALYALVMVGAFMMLVPYSLIPFSGIACMSVGLVATYFYKWKFKSNAMMQHHMRYIISTVWWSTLILIIGVGLFCSILGANGDWSSLNALFASMERGVIVSEADMQQSIMQFVNVNASLISWVALFTLPPYPLFLIVRTISGVRSVIKG